MKTLILYYSYTGNCKKYAEKLQSQISAADLCEVKEKRRLNMFQTFIINCPKAALRKSTAIQEITVDLNLYDKIIIVAPIWNSYPAPVFNSMVKTLPIDKDVELYMCSGGGDSSKSKVGTCNFIKNAGCNLIEYHDIKTTGITK